MGFFRYFLAVLVVLYHMDFSPETFFFMQSSGPVNTFFFISGFLMPLSFERNYIGSNTINLLSTFRFFFNRFLRIYPIYWLALLIGYLDYKYINAKIAITSEEPNIFRHLILIGMQGERLAGGINLVPLNWTLDFEMQWYILIPFLFLLREKKYEKFLIVLLVITSFSGLYRYLAILPSLANILPSHASFFIGGYLLYRGRLLLENQYLPKDIMFLFFTGVIIFIFSFIYFPYGYDYDTGTSLPYLAGKYDTGKLYYLIGKSVTLFSLICISIALLFRHVSNKPSRLDELFGDLSYPLYILHFSLGSATTIILSKIWVGFGLEVHGWLYWVYIVLVTIAALTLFSYMALKIITYPIEKIRNQFKREPLNP